MSSRTSRGDSERRLELVGGGGSEGERYFPGHRSWSSPALCR